MTSNDSTNVPGQPASAGTDCFYERLPALKHFREVSQSRHYQAAPSDWHVVITDVVNSTKAIESGQYKHVNLVGATTIIGLLNAAGSIQFPFVFGGDGATFLIPPALLDRARNVLLATKNRARDVFQLELRVGIVPVERIQAAGYAVQVAKLEVSEAFAQAVFAGGGLIHAESLVKKPPPGESYELPADPKALEADFSGLECRWNPVPTDKEEIVTLLVQARGQTAGANDAVYQKVIQRMEEIFGARDGHHPIARKQMSLSTRAADMQAERRSKAGRRGRVGEWLIVACMLIENWLGRWVFRWRLKVGPVDWGRYQDVLVQNTDSQKFDDMIRTVVSCSRASRRAFEAFLEQQRQEGLLCYGVHVTDRALLTCLVFDRHNRHFHFVDGADGGYALAARTLKRQLLESSAPERGQARS